MGERGGGGQKEREEGRAQGYKPATALASEGGTCTRARCATLLCLMATALASEGGRGQKGVCVRVCVCVPPCSA